MKKEQLKEYIKGKIYEKLYAGAGSALSIKNNPAYSKIKDKIAIDKELRNGGSVELSENLNADDYVSFIRKGINYYGKIISIDGDTAKVKYELGGEDTTDNIPLKSLNKINTSAFNPLEEMAKAAIVYNVAPDFEELAKNVKTGGPISPAKLKAVVDFLRDKETITGPEIAAGLGYPGQMPRIYPIFSALIKSGALISSKEEPDGKYVEPETQDIIGSDEPEEMNGDESPAEVKPQPKSSPEASAFIRSKEETIKNIIRSYRGSRGRIYSLDEVEYRDYLKTIEKSQEANLAKYERLSGELANDIKKLKPELQEEVLALLNTIFKEAGFDMIGSLLASKAGRNPKPGGVPSYDDEDDTESQLDDLDLDELDELLKETSSSHRTIRFYSLKKGSQEYRKAIDKIIYYFGKEEGFKSPKDVEKAIKDGFDPDDVMDFYYNFEGEFGCKPL